VIFFQNSESQIVGPVKISALFLDQLWQTSPVTTLKNARNRARTEVRTEILTKAKEHLAVYGAAGLSLRAVARDLGLVSSAVYRYFENRDALLTAMIIDAYDSLGATTEASVHATRAETPRVRWVKTAEAIRAWALTHRHEYFLLYGAPVPGYAAPDQTVVPGTRVSLALVQLVRDAYADGHLSVAVAPTIAVSEIVRAELDVLLVQVAPQLPSDSFFAMMLAWTQLFGLLSFELFGQTYGVVTNHGALFHDAVDSMAATIGLP
jgi:AcrR family transcriptional regulator